MTTIRVGYFDDGSDNNLATRLASLVGTTDRRLMPIVNAEAYGWKGDFLATSASANDTAIAAAIAAAKVLGSTGGTGAVVQLPPGLGYISTPIVLPRTGQTPANAVHLVGSTLLGSGLQGAATFPANRGMVEWEATTNKAWHQRLANLHFYLPGVDGVRAIWYKQNGTKDTYNNIALERAQIDLQNLVIECSNSFCPSMIKLEGSIFASRFDNVFGNPSRGTALYSTILFETDTTINGAVPTSGDSPGLWACLLANTHGSVRAGGYSRTFVGRMVSCVWDTAFCDGGLSGSAPSYHFTGSLNCHFRQISHEGAAQLAQYRFESCQNITAEHMGVGTPVSRDPGWQASHAYAVGDLVIPTNMASYTGSTPGTNGQFKCTTAGTSGSSEPTWALSGTTSDGTVVWTYQGPAVGNGVELIGSTDCVFRTRYQNASAAAFSRAGSAKLVKIDSTSARNRFLGWNYTSRSGPTALSGEIQIDAPASANNYFDGADISSGGLGYQSAGTYAFGAIAPTAIALAGTDLAPLTAAADTTLHFHTADRARSNHTGTQDESTITPVALYDAGNSGTAITLTYTAARPKQKITMTGNATITIASIPAGGSLEVHVDTGAGSFTGTFAVTGMGTLRWFGGSAPTVTATASKRDVYVFEYDGTDVLGAVIGQGA